MIGENVMLIVYLPKSLKTDGLIAGAIFLKWVPHCRALLSG